VQLSVAQCRGAAQCSSAQLSVAQCSSVQQLSAAVQQCTLRPLRVEASAPGARPKVARNHVGCWTTTVVRRGSRRSWRGLRGWRSLCSPLGLYGLWRGLRWRAASGLGGWPAVARGLQSRRAAPGLGHRGLRPAGRPGGLAAGAASGLGAKACSGLWPQHVDRHDSAALATASAASVAFTASGVACGGARPPTLVPKPAVAPGLSVPPLRPLRPLRGLTASAACSRRAWWPARSLCPAQSLPPLRTLQPQRGLTPSAAAATTVQSL
jgi:hypothetical protein